MVLGKLGLFSRKTEADPVKIEGPSADRIAAVLAKSVKRDGELQARKPIAVKKLEQIQSELQSQIDPERLQDEIDAAEALSDRAFSDAEPLTGEPADQASLSGVDYSTDREDDSLDQQRGLDEDVNAYALDAPLRADDIDDREFAAETGMQASEDALPSESDADVRADDLRTLVIERGAAIIRDDEDSGDDYLPPVTDAHENRDDRVHFDDETAFEEQPLRRGLHKKPLIEPSPAIESREDDLELGTDSAEGWHSDAESREAIAADDDAHHHLADDQWQDDFDRAPDETIDAEAAEVGAIAPPGGQFHDSAIAKPSHQDVRSEDIIIPLEALDSGDASDITHCVSEYLTYLLESGTIPTQAVPQEAIWSSCVSDYAATVAAGGHREYLLQSGVAAGKSVAAVEACANGFVAMDATDFGQNFADLLDIVDAVPGLEDLLNDGTDSEEIEEMLASLDKRFTDLGGLEELARRQQAWLTRLPNVRAVPLDDWQDEVESVAQSLKDRA